LLKTPISSSEARPHCAGRGTLVNMTNDESRIAEAIQLHDRALAELDAGRLSEAEADAASSLAIFESEDGLESPDVANVATTLGAIADARGDSSAALDHARKACRIMDALEGRCVGSKADAIRVAALGGAGTALRVMGQYGDAEPWLRRAITVAERTVDAQLLAGALNNLAVLFKYTGNFDEGERLYLRALSLAEENSAQAATLYHNLGGLDHARGRFESAEPHARRAVEIRARLLGDDHLDTLADACALAGVLDGLARYTESEPIYRRALAAFERLLGPEHYEIAVNLNNLAGVRWSLGDAVEAEVLYRRALEMKRRLLGPDHPDTAVTGHNLASMLEDLGRTAEARTLAAHARCVFESVLSEPHPKIDAARSLCTRLGG
jgi:tetratricopeptide (TPR) repeat protein